MRFHFSCFLAALQKHVNVQTLIIPAGHEWNRWLEHTARVTYGRRFSVKPVDHLYYFTSLLPYIRTPVAPAHGNLIYFIKYPCKCEYLNKNEKLCTCMLVSIFSKCILCRCANLVDLDVLFHMLYRYHNCITQNLFPHCIWLNIYHIENLLKCTLWIQMGEFIF